MQDLLERPYGADFEPAAARYLSMVRLRNGRFLRDEFYWDTRKVMNQMGLMPSLAATQSTVGRGFLWAAS